MTSLLGEEKDAMRGAPDRLTILVTYRKDRELTVERLLLLTVKRSWCVTVRRTGSGGTVARPVPDPGNRGRTLVMKKKGGGSVF